ncbi:glycosyl hydrolase [Algibacter miyuki]|uniref:Glycosyl hydrolase n=1 Tax=Algibacter miyuki TaxID=1306933 RepID=A0ABV5H2Z7_9FLAO|nr:glycosyl hydrolase [Algibacter miyuki]MDN3663961.1 glycosyl hydrolase [Algibacter miyuki]
MKKVLLLVWIVVLSVNPMFGQSLYKQDSTFDKNSILETGFQSPPNEAKARTWWHWISGNVSKSGITKDLEAMKEVGIQEAQLFNVKLEFPDGPVKYLSEEWLDLFHFSAKEAKRLGLELTFHNSAGWSSSGGPWITPEYAMQITVFTEVTVQGGKLFKDQLPQPKTKLNYYKDIAVLAFPKPQTDIKIDGLDYKNLTDRIRNHLLPDTKAITASAVINKNDIIDLTSKITKDGFIEWNVPKGEWIILRLGHTPTGKSNHPAPDGGRGLEVDKMSKKAVDVYWDGGIQPIINKLGDLIGTTVNNCLIDSYEVGTTNWTAGFDTEFKKLRGYSLTSYLPTLAGYYVESGEVSERFLWDFRRTIGDLMSKNYYAHFGELCHENGMKFSVEPYWGPFDNMQVGATGDIVMCEFWSGGYPFFDSPKFVSSIAHLSGSSIVGAESFTGIGGWDEHPAVLKSIGDQAWAQGITRFIFHTYVHQPWDVAPGLALSYHGTDFNRLNTWWSQGKAFMDYIARSQFLLQQGQNVADVLVFTGESSPNTAFLMPEIKAMGFDYDLIGANKLAGLTVKNGDIYTSVGNKYKVLVLPNSSWMKPETLSKIEALTEAGAKVIGERPYKSPSLENYPKSDDKIDKLAENLWNSGLVKKITIEEFLSKSKTPSDFRIEEGDASDISFIHRKTEDADIYFIANAKKESREITGRFRVKGKQPELWNSESGEVKSLAVWVDNEDGTTSVPIQLGVEASVFVIFRKPVAASAHITKISETLKKPQLEPLSNLKIIKAEYGSFLQDGLVDITDKVKAAVEDNKLKLQAGRGFCDCDPAMGYKKEFRMEYKIGEEIKRIYVEEREFVNIDATDKGSLTILKAVFGKFKPETKEVPKYYKTFDITEKIKGMVSSGVLEIPIEKSLIDGYVTEGKNKVLRLTFSTDGVEHVVSVPEGRVLNLSKDISKTKLVNTNGKVNWVTSYPGEITYQTSLGMNKTIKVKSVPKPIELVGDWNIEFKENLSTPIKTVFNNLVSWSNSDNNAIKYYSGTATYQKNFNISKKIFKKDTSFELDLGSVGVIAEVIINGKNAGILWKAPFRINIDDFVKAGQNTLEVRVTNLWPNRLIGDENLSLDFERKGEKTKSLPNWLLNNTQRPSKRTTFPAWKHWSKNDALFASGLLGPVKINVFQKIILE